MANYTYKCYLCVLTKDVSHPISEEPKIVCDRCGASMKRIIVSTNIKKIIDFNVDRDLD